MSVSVNINNHNIKLLVSNQNKITRWETVELAPGLVKDGQILKPEQTAQTLQAIFKQASVPRTDITASVTGMSFVYRILGLPEVKGLDLQEAIERATQKEINVPLHDLYIDWKIVNEKEDSLEIFVLGVPRLLVDAVVETFKLANLKLSSLDINSLALARLVNQPEALIADFGKDWFDIVIVSEGLPVTLHSVATKGNFRELEDSLFQMNEEIRRTVDFFNLTHKENAIKAGESVHLSGLSKTSDETGLLLEKYLPETAPVSDGHMVYPASFVPADFAVLLGLALKTQSAGSAKNSTRTNYRDINLNLLAGRRRVVRSTVTFKQVLLPAVIVLGVILLTPLLLASNNARAEVAGLEKDLYQVNRELRLSRLILSETETTETRITQLLEDARMIRREREVISGPGNLADALNIIVQGFSNRVSYYRINTTAFQIIIDGWAEDRNEVLVYTAYLESRQRFAEVLIGSMEDSQTNSGRVDFRIFLDRQ